MVSGPMIDVAIFDALIDVTEEDVIIGSLENVKSDGLLIGNLTLCSQVLKQSLTEKAFGSGV